MWVAKGVAGGKRFHGHEVLVLLNHAGLLIDPAYRLVAKHAFALLVVVAKSFMEPVLDLAWNHGGVMSWECGSCRLAPASTP